MSTLPEITASTRQDACLLEVRGLCKSFGQDRSLFQALTGRHGNVLHAVRDVSLAVRPGEILGVVGESGCGKSTLGRCIAGLHAPSAGEMLWQGRPLADMGGRRAASRLIQMIFQDPYSSLNPRMTVGQTIEEVLIAHGLHGDHTTRALRVDELLAIVGLSARHKERLPHALSGGQRQRVSIARALAVEPKLIIADEPVWRWTHPCKHRSSTCSRNCATVSASLSSSSRTISTSCAISATVSRSCIWAKSWRSPRRTPCSNSAPSLHTGAAVGDPMARSRPQDDRHQPGRGTARSAASPGGLQLFKPLRMGAG